jgi:ketosteroid isomerase-like protein
MANFPEDEIRTAFAGYVDTRNRIDRGEMPWSALEKFFTEDAVFIDPAWGRVEGLDKVREFWMESMAGLEEWSFPEAWTMVDGNRVVTMWLQRMGQRPDGTRDEIPGISVLYYAGHGKFCYEMDLLNMAHVMEVMQNGNWTPGPDLNIPPATVDRDFSLPEHRRHLADD